MKKFLELDTPVIGDGAIGEYLYSLGLPKDRLACEAVLINPDLVLQVHREYVEAGSQFILTNTFDANPVKLSKRGIEYLTAEINTKAVELARKAGGKLVGGSIGPLGRRLTYPYTAVDKAELIEDYKPQVEALITAGIDIVFIETQVDPLETTAIVECVREIDPDIPIAILFTFDRNMRTLTGMTPEDVVSFAHKLGAYAVGVNHSVSPLQVLEIGRRMLRHTDLPVILEPNSGEPIVTEGKIVYPDAVEHFAQFGLTAMELGASVIGGCCGTRPAGIRELVNLIREGRKPSIVVEWQPIEEDIIREEVKARSQLKHDIEHRCARLVELLPPKSGALQPLIHKVIMFKEAGATAVSIVDSPMGKVRIAPYIAGLYIKEHTDVEVVVHFALRDRSLTRVQSDLVGMFSVGLCNVLIVAGDPPELGDYPQATAVYDLTTEEAIKLANLIREGRDLAGNKLTPAVDAYIGATINFVDELDKIVTKVHRRMEYGADFFVTQPIYEPNIIKALLDKLPDVKIVAGMMAFKNKTMVYHMANEVPGVKIPEWIITKVDSLTDKELPKFSIELIHRIMEELTPYVHGFYFIAVNPDMLTELLH